MHCLSASLNVSVARARRGWRPCEDGKSVAAACRQMGVYVGRVLDGESEQGVLSRSVMGHVGVR